MDCRDAEQLVIDVLVGEADTTERSVLQEHMDGCPRCRRIYAALLETSEAVEELGMYELPAGFDQRYASRLARKRAAVGLPARFKWVAAIFGSDVRFASVGLAGVLLSLLARVLLLDTGRPPWSPVEWNLFVTLATSVLLVGITLAIKQSVQPIGLFSRRRYEK